MQKVLIVDDDDVNIEIAKQCLMDMYQILTAHSAEEALKVMEEILPDIILLDVNMPHMNGFELLKHMRKKYAFRHIPVIFLTAEEGDAEIKGLNLGAVDYIKKPFNISLLKKRVGIHVKLIMQQRQLERYAKNLMIDKIGLEERLREQNLSLMNLERAVISIIATLIESKDGYTGGHVTRTAKYMKIFMEELHQRDMLMGTPKQSLDMIALFSKLHDVGKIGVPDSILTKHTVLDVSENLQMRLHTIFGAKAIKDSIQQTAHNVYLNYAMQMARSHHEWWNGTGYPDNLAGVKIPLMARIIAICNEYDKARAQRRHEGERTHKEAMRIIRDSAGTQFDPTLAEVFIELSLENVAED